MAIAPHAVLCLAPPADKLNGGMRYLFRLAEGLRDLGYDAAVLEQQGRRPGWFKSTAPVHRLERLQPREGETIILPEDQPEALQMLADWPQRKIIYCQNHFYAALSGLDQPPLSRLGVSGLLAGSATIAAWCQDRHPDIPVALLPCSVDRDLFKPLDKAARIVCLPRKRRVEALYIQDMFRHRYPQWAAIEWQPLFDRSEIEVARAMGQAAVFLSLSRLDGFGLTPIEAMAAGCVVAGFTGIGGREYATPANGFWVDEDDCLAAVAALDRALVLWRDGGQAYGEYRAAADTTAARYTPAVFLKALHEGVSRFFV